MWTFERHRIRQRSAARSGHKRAEGDRSEADGAAGEEMATSDESEQVAVHRAPLDKNPIPKHQAPKNTQCPITKVLICGKSLRKSASTPCPRGRVFGLHQPNRVLMQQSCVGR